MYTNAPQRQKQGAHPAPPLRQTSFPFYSGRYPTPRSSRRRQSAGLRDLLIPFYGWVRSRPCPSQNILHLIPTTTVVEPW